MRSEQTTPPDLCPCSRPASHKDVRDTRMADPSPDAEVIRCCHSPPASPPAPPQLLAAEFFLRLEVNRKTGKEKRQGWNPHAGTRIERGNGASAPVPSPRTIPMASREAAEPDTENARASANSALAGGSPARTREWWHRSSSAIQPMVRSQAIRAGYRGAITVLAESMFS